MKLSILSLAIMVGMLTSCGYYLKEEKAAPPPKDPPPRLTAESTKSSPDNEAESDPEPAETSASPQPASEE